MQLNPGAFSGVYATFLHAWPPERIHRMTIAEYADLANKDSLCYWLEYGTKDLGQIGGTALHKFELWRPRYKKDFKDQRFSHDDTYAWAAGWGDTAIEAFHKIREQIVLLVDHTINRDWEAIEELKFHSLAKWKIAFLFSNKHLFPVYSRRALLVIGRGLGKTFTAYDRLLDIQQYIIAQKPHAEDIVEYAHRTYSQFAEKKNKDNTNFYLIGSKYGGVEQRNSVDKMPDFLQRNCVAIGFLDWINFSEMMGKNRQSVNEWVDKNFPNDNSALRDVRSYFRFLSQIKEGDIIAIKSSGSFGNLNIVAYAQVVSREGSIYFHDDEDLGHCIHVEFLDADFNFSLGLNYAKTLHQLKPETHGEHFNLIFGWFSAHDLQNEVEEEDISEESGEQVEHTPDQGYNEKTETTFTRSPMAATVVTRYHNQIQNRFMRYLEKEFPNYFLSGEKRYVDAKRENEHELVLYEIKPFANAYECIRSGIGQLIGYWHNSPTSKTKSIVIVGPNPPDVSGQQFIDSLKKIIGIPFSYIAFDAANLKAQSY